MNEQAMSPNLLGLPSVCACACSRKTHSSPGLVVDSDTGGLNVVLEVVALGFIS